MRTTKRNDEDNYIIDRPCSICYLFSTRRSTNDNNKNTKKGWKKAARSNIFLPSNQLKICDLITSERNEQIGRPTRRSIRWQTLEMQHG